MQEGGGRRKFCQRLKQEDLDSKTLRLYCKILSQKKKKSKVGTKVTAYCLPGHAWHKSLASHKINNNKEFPL